MPINTMKTIYCSYFNTIMSYGLFLWGNSLHSLKIFKMQKKKIIRIMTSCNNRASCRNLFRKSEILPLASQYIFSLMLFVVSNKNIFVLNSDNLYHLSSNFTVYQKEYIVWALRSIIIFLPTLRRNLVILGNLKLINCVFFHTHYFYSIEEYFQYKTNTSYRLITSKH
jgi:hypothetical protein